MKKICFLLLLIFVLSFSETKAGKESKGKDFWLSFMPNFHNNIDSYDPKKKFGDSLYIFINAEKPTKGKITYRDKAGIESVEKFTINNANQLYTFKVCFADYEIVGYNFHGRLWANYQTETPAPQYFHIETDNDVTVYAHTQAVTTSDAFLVLPYDNVGLEYYVMSYSSDGRYSLTSTLQRTPSQFLIVATQNNTVVEIETPVATFKHPAGKQTIRLNKGYSYLVQAKFGTVKRNPDLTGTHIVSDKPIAVFGGHQRANIPVTDSKGTSRDCLVEQIPSVSTWGKNAFLIPPHEPNDINSQRGSLYRVLACQDNTRITINGTMVKILNKGEFYESPLTSPAVLTASQPILAGIFKYTAGKLNYTRALGDPFMMLIPPKEQFIKKCKVINVQAWEKNSGNNNYYPVYSEQYITLVAPKNALDSVYIDVLKIAATEFKKISGTNYYYTHQSVKAGIHNVAAKDAIGVYIYGYGGANSYGYTGGMGLKAINYDPPSITVTDTCFKSYGKIITSNIQKRYLVNVSEVQDSTKNAKVNIANYKNKYQTTFTVELINKKYDSQAIVSAKDNAHKIVFKRVEIPGLTFSVPGNMNADTLPVFVVNARPTDTVTINIINHGKFKHKIISQTLAQNDLGEVITSFSMIKPKQTDSVKIKFTMKDNIPKRDTLYLTTKCGSIAVAAFYIIASECDLSAFEYPDFTDRTKLMLNGKASITQNIARLTGNLFYQVGTMWYNETVPVLDGFSTDFAFRFSQGNNYNCTDGSAQGADGIAFVIQNSGTAAIGYAGGSIGYEGIYNSLAIEFDTYSNDAHQIENFFDPNGNHIAVQTMRTEKNTSKHTMQANLAMNDKIMPMLADSTIYYARIVFRLKDKTLKVFLDTVNNPTKEVLRLDKFEIGKYLKLDRGYRAFVGFTSATGCAVENHDILSWSFCPEFPNPDTDVEAQNTDIEFESPILVSPNPFNAQCDISLNLDNSGLVTLSIVDMIGYTVATIHNGVLTSGNHKFTWMPESISRGVYFVRLNAGTQQIIKKIIFTY